MFTTQIQVVQGRDLLRGSRIAVYKNLHKSAWSIRALDGAHKGKVVAHAQAVAITGCHMHVNGRAQAKIAAGSPRAVHAWIVGRLADDVELVAPQRISYRPHQRGEFFIVDTGRAIWTAPAVIFTDAAYVGVA